MVCWYHISIYSPGRCSFANTVLMLYVVILQANIHRFYTDSLMNPFTTPQQKIVSKRFESNVMGLVQQYNGATGNWDIWWDTDDEIGTI